MSNLGQGSFFRAAMVAGTLVVLLLLIGCGGSSGSVTVGVRPLSLGRESSCLLSDGTVYCWGEGSGGELGDGLGSDRIFSRPIAFDAVRAGFVLLSLGKSHGCALRVNGALYCWGEGRNGALGNGSLVPALRPLAVDSFDGSGRQVRLFDTGRYHSCAVTEGNELYCWGYNGNGQLGIGTVDNEGDTPSALTPTLVQTAIDLTASGTGADALSITSIATGGHHSCLTYSDGSAACWGYGEYGQLGNECFFGSLGDNLCSVDRLTPMALPYFDGSTRQRYAKKIFAGLYHSCVINENGQLFCFGFGNNGRLGVNQSTSSYSVPQHVGNIPVPITSLSLGDSHGCVLLVTNEVYCFGSNQYGQLGNRSTVESAIPVRVSFMPNNTEVLVGVAAGADHSCAWDDRGQYYCWGKNTSGQLGLGTQRNGNSTPTKGIY